MKTSIFGEDVYSHLECTIVAFDSQELREAFVQLEFYKKHYFCVGFLSYEAYKAFEDERFSSSFPLLYFGVFAQKEPFIPSCHQDYFYPHHCVFIDEQNYLQKIQSLREEIAQGNTYQGNFTTTLEFDTMLSSRRIFDCLIQRQNTAYKAFLPTPFGDILSFSPELFFSIDQGVILTKPMKGTMPRGKTQEEDESNALFLAQDLKNRSENVMIVDLLRNDLSKIIQKGSLEVPKLFEIETYETLFQMTSSIQGVLRENLSLFELFQALFPCGSITGAPKKNTIEILQALEGRERGVYCGAIGVLEPKKAIFSIPIRTIFKQDCKCLYGVGSGIVWDSKPEEEYKELQTKMSFLFPPRDFALLETMRYNLKPVSQEFLEIPCGVAFEELHWKRLRESAKALGFVYPHRLQEAIRQKCQTLLSDAILRVLLHHNGEYEIQVLPLDLLLYRDVIVRKKSSQSDLDAFKTTRDRNLSFLDENKLFDVIEEEEGILLEGKRSNLVLELEEGLFTPRANGRFLQGICREVLLQKGVIQERELLLEDLKKAKRIFCINSVRGMIEVNLSQEG